MKELKRLVGDLVVAGVDDWVYLAEVVGMVERSGAASTDREIRRMTLAVIRDAVQQGLMEVGDVDVVGKKGFQKWTIPLAAALERVDREWEALARRPNLWEICWLCNTKKGDEMGEQMLNQGEQSA